MSQKEFLILTGATIYTENKILHQSAVIIKNKIIEAIVPIESIKKFSNAQVLNFPEKFSLLPGFIDMHIHGANGKDVMDASFDALATISKALVAEGTTSYLATTMTASAGEIESVLCHVRDYVKRQDEVNGAEILGVHLEGPFISANKVGAQSADFILNPETKYIEHWQKVSNQIIKLVTLAPELENSSEFITYLRRHHIIAAVGHTDATFDEAMLAIKAGCSHVTHLFNAMRGLHQREPGMVTAALLSDDVMAEVIVDGVHLHPAIVQLALKAKGSDKLVLVTDAMRAKCMCDGEYDLGGKAVTVKQGVARLSDNTLAGSTLKMSSAVKNMLKFTSCSLSDIVKMTSANPAKALGVFDRKGSIAENKAADLVILDAEHNVAMTVCAGKVISCKQVVAS